MAKKTSRGFLGRVTTRDLIIVGLVGGVIYAMTRKPIQTESRVTVDWTSIARRDITDLLERRRS